MCWADVKERVYLSQSIYEMAMVEGAKDNKQGAANLMREYMEMRDWTRTVGLEQSIKRFKKDIEKFDNLQISFFPSRGFVQQSLDENPADGIRRLR